MNFVVRRAEKVTKLPIMICNMLSRNVTLIFLGRQVL